MGKRYTKLLSEEDINWTLMPI
ncbi:hypothetical protein JL09_g6582 [Pichia kudriavzevii]|uniref:Uncharacterized protein n=1 Tax=Pichia kudriavzevii TaxID=4909 RepID=A0A099NQS3_PICKU|nr:hypothetical protein JL09_g6584 [Pichia kudriavzevii]KGK34271.1 hypothetical protein JL09_g6582 [Pichia kudriavzevii]